jgi:hypothetical protein
MEEGITVRFADAARRLAIAARAQGITPPSFRSPPRLFGVARSLRRRPDGTTQVAVVLRGRPWSAVLADMIEGVVVANRLSGNAADRLRTALWSAVEQPAAEARSVA